METSSRQEGVFLQEIVDNLVSKVFDRREFGKPFIFTLSGEERRVVVNLSFQNQYQSRSKYQPVEGTPALILIVRNLILPKQFLV